MKHVRVNQIDEVLQLDFSITFIQDDYFDLQK